MSLSIETVTNSIASLSVSGLKICDLDEIPSSADLQRSPMLYPSPNQFIAMLGVERDSFGSPAMARKTVEYTLRYVFTYAPIGTERSLKSAYPGMVSMALDILDAIIANDDLTGAIDITPSITGGFGAIRAPDDVMYYGCMIDLRVVEYVN